MITRRCRSGGPFARRAESNAARCADARARRSWAAGSSGEKDVLNPGGIGHVRPFFDTEATSDPARTTAVRIERYKSIFADTGRLELVSVDDQTPTSLTLSVHAAHGQTISMTFTLEPGGAHRLTSLQLDQSR
jgi:hypothetical protein